MNKLKNLISKNSLIEHISQPRMPSEDQSKHTSRNSAYNSKEEQKAAVLTKKRKNNDEAFRNRIQDKLQEYDEAGKELESLESSK